MNKKYIIISITAFSILLIGLTVAYFTYRIENIGGNLNLIGKNVGVRIDDVNLFTDEEIFPGWEISKEFTIENNGNADFTYDILIEGLQNTFVTEGYLQYKLTSTDAYNMANYVDVPKTTEATDTILLSRYTIHAKTIQHYTLTFRYLDTEEDQSEDMGKTFSGRLGIVKHQMTLEEQLLADNPTRLTRADNDFANTLTTTNTGTLYETNKTEDNSTVYYFAGDARNNWVKFGSESDGTPICWRIIRTNTTREGGGIRLLYSGKYDTTTNECGNTTTGYINKTTTQFNSSHNDTMYVGYMYGTTGSLANNRTNTNSSTIKTFIDNWYKNTSICSANSSGVCQSELASLVNNKAIYCNDRAVGSGNYVASDSSRTMYYAARDRLLTNEAPTLKCGGKQDGTLYESTQAKADKFTVDSTTGNGNLTYPLALMTADEIAFAGGKNQTSLTSPYAWYFKNKNNTGTASTDIITGSVYWWLLSPNYFNFGGAYVFDVFNSNAPGYLSSDYVHVAIGARPAISLASDALWNSGTGEYNNPYTVK